MNAAKIIEILENGGTYDALKRLLIHPSFRKGTRKCSSSISWNAVQRKHGIYGTNRLVDNGHHVYALSPAN